MTRQAIHIEPRLSGVGPTGCPSGIAIIGMAGRFPGANNIDEFWGNLRDGVESVSLFTDQELREAGVAAATLRDPRYVKAAPVLDGVDLFDASFFNCSPREARITDPQHRLFLECAWQALENAGYVVRIREPDWHQHRMLKGPEADINLHVFSSGCPEIERILALRDRLRTDLADRDLYESTKRDLAKREWACVDDYALAKSTVIEEIIARA